MVHPEPTWAAFRRLTYMTGGLPVTIAFSQRLGAAIAFVGYRLGLSANALSLLGGGVAIAASVLYATIPTAGLLPPIILIVIYQLAYAFDCADGQLARATQTASHFGAWLDIAIDYARYISIGFALLFVLLGSAPAPLAFLSCAAFLVGTIVTSHHVSFTRQARQGGQPERSNVPFLRKAVRLALDTPTVLLVICALRPHPEALMIYVSLTGIAYVAVAAASARSLFR